MSVLMTATGMRRIGGYEAVGGASGGKRGHWAMRELREGHGLVGELMGKWMTGRRCMSWMFLGTGNKGARLEIGNLVHHVCSRDQ